ncbi:5-hydroxytryptamine receptor 3C-like [Rhopilema esculentum]|uniref:5-hydroxytryptamine receptor 3C-like n=1 Tax=Rhopilema esculentum TaxID=499914 RepID=UPI0031DCE97C
MRSTMNLDMPFIVVILMFVQRILAYDEEQNVCRSLQTQEEKLIAHLFGCNRNFSRIFPKLNNLEEDRMKIQLKITVRNIEEINASDNEATMMLRFDTEWQSSLLNWNASKFGISRLTVDASSVWTPKFELDKNLDMIGIEANAADTVYLTSLGRHSLTFYRKVRLACEDKACLFPMDEYNCSFTIFLKRLNASMVDFVAINKSANKISDKKPETYGTWDLKSFEFNGSKLFSDEQGWPVLRGLRFEANVKRRHGFFLITVLFPMTLLGILSMCSVFLPATTGDRIALLLSCLLSIMISLETTFKHVPNNSDRFPILVFLIIIILLNTVLQIILAGICLNWANKNENKKKPGKRLIFVVFYILRIVFLAIPWLWKKIKHCMESRRKRKINDGLEEDPSMTISKPKEESNQKAENSKEENKEEDEEKSYKSAIKIVDRLAMSLAICNLAVLILTAITIYSSKQAGQVCSIFNEYVTPFLTLSSK